MTNNSRISRITIFDRLCDKFLFYQVYHSIDINIYRVISASNGSRMEIKVGHKNIKFARSRVFKSAGR